MVDFIIIGAQKAGTTSAAHNLNLHPRIRVFDGINEYGQRELEFFNQHWERGKDWYLSHFPHTGYLQGEKTAELLHRLCCHSRIARTVPSAKLIVLLRCPVARAFSQWKMARFSKRDETRSFEEVVAAELRQLALGGYKHRFYNLSDNQVSGWREGYILKGCYAEQLAHLYRFVDRSQVYVGISERIRGNKAEEYNRIFTFLGVPSLEAPFGEHFIGASTADMSPSLRNELGTFYAPQNEALFALLGRTIPEWC